MANKTEIYFLKVVFFEDKNNMNSKEYICCYITYYSMSDNIYTFFTFPFLYAII